MPQDVEQPGVEWDDDTIEVGVRLLQRSSPRVSIGGDLDAPPLFFSTFDLPALRYAGYGSLARKGLQGLESPPSTLPRGGGGIRDDKPQAGPSRYPGERGPGQDRIRSLSV